MEDLLIVVGVILFFGGVGALLLKRWRGWKAGVAALIGAVLLAIGASKLNDQAREQGFANHSEREAARKAGIESPEAYRAEKVRLDAENAKRAEDAAAQKAAEKGKRDEEARQAVAAAASAKAEEEKKCRSDLACWGNQSVFVATSACKPLVERLAKHDFEWTDSWSEPKFSHFRWKDKAAGVVIHVGDKIKLQNGFGAWTHYTYECDFNPTTGQVLDVRARPGRL